MRQKFMDDELKQKLKAWKVSAAIPARFQAEVWQRIAAQEAHRRHSIWPRFVPKIVAALRSPAYATAVVLTAAVAGAGAAQWHARGAVSQTWRALETRYVQSIDPYAALATPFDR